MVFARLVSVITVVPVGQDAVTKLLLLSVLGIRYVTIPALSWQHLAAYTEELRSIHGYCSTVGPLPKGVPS